MASCVTVLEYVSSHLHDTVTIKSATLCTIVIELGRRCPMHSPLLIDCILTMMRVAGPRTFFLGRYKSDRSRLLSALACVLTSETGPTPRVSCQTLLPRISLRRRCMPEPALPLTRCVCTAEGAAPAICLST